jgi:hypothetical protein
MAEATPRETFQYEVFVSHSSKDKPVARDLAERLEEAGLSARQGGCLLASPGPDRRFRHGRRPGLSGRWAEPPAARPPYGLLRQPTGIGLVTLPADAAQTSCAFAHQFAVDELLADGVAFAEIAAEDLVGEGVLDPVLDHALEWAGAELRVVALVGQELPGLVLQEEPDVSLGEPLDCPRSSARLVQRGCRFNLQ